MAEQGPGQQRPAGWKKDPSGRHFGRWWDGQQWTENVISAAKVQGLDPLPPRAEPSIFDDSSQPPPPPSTPTAQTAPPQQAQPAQPAVTYRGPAPTAPGYVPPPPSAKGGGKGWKIALGIILGLFVLMGLCVAVIANSADDAVKQVQADLADGSLDNSTSDTAPVPRTVYKIGDTAKTSDFEVTVYGLKDPQTTTNQFDKPAAGNRYVSVDVQVANKGSSQQTFSSVLGFHLVDSANRQYDLEFTTVEPRAPDGQIPAGGAIRGLAVFEIPEGTTGMRLRVQGSITASGAFFTLT
jgi:hypothetical protein